MLEKVKELWETTKGKGIIVGSVVVVVGVIFFVVKSLIKKSKKSARNTRL